MLRRGSSDDQVRGERADGADAEADEGRPGNDRREPGTGSGERQHEQPDRGEDQARWNDPRRRGDVARQPRRDHRPGDDAGGRRQAPQAGL